MKNILKNTALLIFFSFALTSCVDKWLDMRPDDQVVLEEYWTSAADVEAVVASCYRYMITDDYMYRLFYWGELRSDNIAMDNANTDESNLWNVNIQPDNGITRWNSFYQVINYCNTVIYYAPGVMAVDQNFKEYELRTYLSEALTIRALSYFHLLRTFGKVPLVVKPSKDDSEDFNVPQNTEKEIIDQIIADLTTAEGYARDSWATTASTKGRVTKNAVRALLSDVYLWNQEYDKCIESCDKVLNDKINEIILLETDYLYSKAFYEGNSPESIFELNFNSNLTKNNVTPNLFGNINKNISRGHLKGSASLINAYSLSYDTRLKSTLVAKYSNNKIEMTSAIFKYEGQKVPADFSKELYVFRSASSTANWILYRLPDIYLMKAEALAEIGETSNLRQAITLVNKTYTRANPEIDSLKFEDFNTAASVKKLVLEERRREFAFEGKRWYDLLRLARREGSTANAVQYILPNYSDATLITEKMAQLGAWYLPVNEAQISINRNLKQNDYYNSIYGTK